MTSPSLLSIGSSRQLLADERLVKQLCGSVRRVLHRLLPRERVEGITDTHGCPFRYMTVFRDGDRCRMYFGLPNVRRTDNGNRLKLPERIGYAESVDGIHWETPVLGMVEYEGSRENNLVWMEQDADHLGVGGFTPFRDENPACLPEHRYKVIAEAGPLGKELLGCNGLLALVSADGVRWSMLQRKPVMTGGPGLGNFDTQNVAFWDATRGEYRLYRREVFREGPLNVHREILTATSNDFVHWTKPVRLRYEGGPPEQLYTNGVLPYFRAPHLFLGFPVRYVQRPWSDAVAALPERERREAVIRLAGEEPTAKAPTEAGGQRIGAALTDALFMTSADGVLFHLRGEAFIPPGPQLQNRWFYGDNFPAWGMLATRSTLEDAPDELSFFVSEGSRREGEPNACRRHTLRMDGFVSVQASREGGGVLTRPFTFEGEELRLNFAASAAGSVRVELRDEHGWPLHGFRLEESVECLGDDLDRRVEWRGGVSLASLAGVPVQAFFALVDADLYAFRFCPAS